MVDARASELLLRFCRIVASDGHDRGIQAVQLQALVFLARANRFSRTAKGLTAWLGQTKGSVSQSLSVLQRKGLIARTADSDDLRIVRLDLTDAGHKLLYDPPQLLGDCLLDHLDEPDRRKFTDLLEAMLHAELLRTGGQAFGLCRDCRHFQSTSSANATHHCGLLNVALSLSDADLICLEQQAA